MAGSYFHTCDFNHFSGHMLQVSKAKILAKQARKEANYFQGVDPNIFGHR